MDDSQYRREFLCDFSASMDNALITIDKVSDAAAKKMTDADITGSARIIGVDVARFGSDRSVIQKRQGLAAFEPKIFDDIDNMTLAGMVAQTINEWKPDAVFIDSGRGEGVIDRLRQLGYFITEVNFGGKALNPTYNNKRAEMWDGIRIWLEDGGALPPHTDLKTDLCVPTYKFDSANRMQLESKDDIKKRGGRSPDLGDALALTFSYPVAAKKIGHFGFKEEAVLADYDPFNEEIDMCFRSRAPAPPPPPPAPVDMPAPPPTQASEAVKSVRKAEKKAAAQLQGRKSTILTGSRGVLEAADIRKKSLLGQ